MRHGVNWVIVAFPHAVTVDTDEGYQRGLTTRTVQMIAIGGAIGTGLFYGSGAAIEMAGPALLVAYGVAGLAVFFMMRALGELLLYRPVAGGISEYADEFLGRFAGFSQGWTYWAVWVTTCMAEITVAGKYVNYWWPVIPVLSNVPSNNTSGVTTHVFHSYFDRGRLRGRPVRPRCDESGQCR